MKLQGGQLVSRWGLEAHPIVRTQCPVFTLYHLRYIVGFRRTEDEEMTARRHRTHFYSNNTEVRPAQVGGREHL